MTLPAYLGNDSTPARNEPYVTSPCCPECGNIDPRALLDDSVLEMLHAEGGHEGAPRTLADVPTSIHGTLDAYDSEYTSSQVMYCLACSADAPTRFEFRPTAYVFDSSMGPLNVARVSKAYLARMLYDQADKPDTSEKKVDVKVSIRKRAREGDDDDDDRLVSVKIQGIGRMRAVEAA